MKYSFFRKLNAEPGASDGGAETTQADSATQADSEATQTDSESTQADPEATQATQVGTTLTLDDVLKLVKTIQSPESTKVDPGQTKVDPGQAQADPGQAKADSRDQILRQLLITSANVPQELIDLGLPESPEKLVEYLASPAYKTAAAKLQAASQVQKPNGANPEATKTAPKDKPKEPEAPKKFAEITSAHLTAFDRLFS